jgi:2-oxoisovalerate dehydrogenase E1 component beta subunit
LKEEGVEAEVIDLRTLLPFDREAVLESVKKTSKVIILHEATRTGGMAGELTAVINESAFESLDGPVMRVTSIDTPVPYAPPLEEFFLPQVDDVLKAAHALSAY